LTWWSSTSGFRLATLGVDMSVRILVLEDNAYLAAALTRLLKRIGYDVQHANCCATARALDAHFDLGIFDLELPDGGGIEFSSELMHAGNLGAVVFFTATLDGALFQKARSMAPCIQKTDGIEALLSTIRHTLASAPRHAAGSGNGAQVLSAPKRRGR
jgi:DNA-binding response OmpR family regulator